MRKKSFLMILLMVLIGVLLSAIVLAANPFGTVLGTFNNLLNFFATFITSITKMISDKPGVWLKFMFWIAILAVLYQGASMIPTFNNRTAKIVAVVISIISVVFIPDTVLVAVASLYSGVIFTLIIAVPFGVLVYTSYRIRQTGNRWTFALIAALWLIFIIILSSINTLVDVTVLPREGDPNFIGPPRPSVGTSFGTLVGQGDAALKVIIDQQVIETVISFMLLFAFIFFLYFIVKAFTGGGEGAETDEETEKRKESFKKFFGGLGDTPTKIAASASVLVDNIRKLAADAAQLKRNKKQIDKEISKLLDYAQRFRNAARKIPGKKGSNLLGLTYALNTHLRNATREVKKKTPDETEFIKFMDEAEKTLNGIIADFK